VLAVTLASKVHGPDGEDITDVLQPRVRDVLEKRNVLTAHAGDGEGTSWALLLASHTFSNKTSVELHAPWDGKLAIEETARTLYHDVWPASTLPHALRPAMVEFGEVAVPVSEPTHVTREMVPEDHPRPPADGFVNLGRRSPSASRYGVRAGDRGPPAAQATP
jgi:hypothetical protein